MKSVVGKMISINWPQVEARFNESWKRCFNLSYRKLMKPHINNLIAEIKSAKAIEKEIATSKSKKTIAFKNKWHITNDIILIT